MWFMVGIGHGSHAKTRPSRPETPARGISGVLISWRRIPRWGDSEPRCARLPSARSPRARSGPLMAHASWIGTRRRLRSPGRRPRSAAVGMVRAVVQPPPDLLVDAVLAAAALAVSLLLLGHGGFVAHGSRSGLDLAGGLLAAAASLPLLAWRRAPLAVFLVSAGVSIIAAARGFAPDFPPGPLLALYLLVFSRDEVRPWTPRTAATVGALSAGFLAATAAARGLAAVNLAHGLPWVVAWFAGERSRLRRAHIADLEQRTARVEHHAEQNRLLAVAEERARIARDLHDSAGHAINVIAVRAGTARLRYQHNPQRAHLTLAAIEDLARQTLAELDQLVGTLRTHPADDAPVEAPPGLASLDTLLAQHRAAGHAVSQTRRGNPRPVGAALDQAAYRILQEALTNAARHGAGSAHVELAFGEAALELTVTNPARGTPGAGPSGGHGLIGMRERATLLGGTLHTSCHNGQFRLHARLPYPAPPP
jgi:signal transduction histidine kinase